MPANPHDTRVSDKWEPPACHCLDNREVDKLVAVHPHNVRYSAMKFPTSAGVTTQLQQSMDTILKAISRTANSVTYRAQDEEVVVLFDDLDEYLMDIAIEYKRGHHPAGPC